MIDIPIDPDKFEEKRKKQSKRSKPQDKNKPAKSQKKDKTGKSVQQIAQEMISACCKPYGDKIKYVLYGDIKKPEFPKNATTEVSKIKNPDEAVKVKLEWAVIACEYIAKHLNRWASEKVEGEIEWWYRETTNPFTNRTVVIVPYCEKLERDLPLCLPKYYESFRVKYNDLQSVAKRADKEQLVRLGAGINDFKLSAWYLLEIVSLILSEAEQILSGKAEDNTKMALREFFEKCTDVDSRVINSKIKRIKAVDKIKNLLPKTANKPKGNQTKLYFKEDLISVWPRLKDEIPTLPNIKK